MTQDLQDLPKLLDTLGSPSGFQHNPEHIQKLLLIYALGDSSPLVAGIMECIQVSAGGLGIFVDQALNCELPSSTPLKATDVLAALDAVLGLGHRFRDMIMNVRFCTSLWMRLS